MSSREEQLIRFKMLEEDGRKRAYEREAIPKNDKLFLENIMASSRIMRDELREFNLKKEASLPGYVANAAEYAVPVADHCEGAEISRKDCLITEKGNYVLWSLLKDVDKISHEVLQKRCTFLFQEIDPYNLSSCINDITACYHRSIEVYSDTVGKWHKEGKCLWRIK